MSGSGSIQCLVGIIVYFVLALMLPEETPIEVEFLIVVLIVGVIWAVKEAGEST